MIGVASILHSPELNHGNLQMTDPLHGQIFVGFVNPSKELLHLFRQRAVSLLILIEPPFVRWLNAAESCVDMEALTSCLTAGNVGLSATAPNND